MKFRADATNVRRRADDHSVDRAARRGVESAVINRSSSRRVDDGRAVVEAPEVHHDSDFGPRDYVVAHDGDRSLFRLHEIRLVSSPFALGNAPATVDDGHRVAADWDAPRRFGIGAPSAVAVIHHGHGAQGTKDADPGPGAVEYSNALVNNGALYDGLKRATLADEQIEQTHRRLDNELGNRFGRITFHPPLDGLTRRKAADAKYALLQILKENAYAGFDRIHEDRLVSLDGDTHAWSLQTDGRGRVTIERHGKGGSRIPKESQLSNADAADKLVAMGLRVKPGGWKEGELAKVHAALRMLDDDELAAVRGVELQRVSSLDSRRDAEFEFKLTVDARTKKPSRTDVIRLTDNAFASDGNRFVGDGKRYRLPMSVNVVLHEVGHAIATQQIREASFAQANAAYHLRRADIRFRRMFRRIALQGTRRQNQAFENATNNVQRAIDKLANAKDAYSVRFARRRLTSAMGRRDAAARALRGSVDSVVAAQNRTIRHAKSLGDAITRLDQVTERDGRSTRDHRFEDRFDRVSPPNITDYAATEGMKELNPDGFAFFKTDPAYLERNAPDLYQWYAEKKHMAD